MGHPYTGNKKSKKEWQYINGRKENHQPRRCG